MIFKKVHFRQIALLAGTALLLVSLVVGCGQSNTPVAENNTTKEKATINIGYVTWAEDIAVSNLWKGILEEKGYKVNLTQLDVAPLFVGLNKGDLDVFMDSWLPITHQTYWEKYKENLDDYGQWYDGQAKIGIVVPSYVTIDSIKQMQDNKAKFSSQIIGIDAGAGIMKATEKAIKDDKLDFKLVQGSEAAMMAAMDKAYRNKEWIAITGWSPHWMFAKYDLKYLKDDTANKDFGESEGVHTLANKSLAQKAPEVVAMFKKFKMDDKQIGGLEDVMNQGTDPLVQAKKWMSENQDMINTWLAK